MAEGPKASHGRALGSGLLHATGSGTPGLGCTSLNPNIGAFMIRIGFWAPLYYTYKQELPK